MNGTVSRKDITLTECFEEEPTYRGYSTVTYWEAGFRGPLPTGETLIMSRESRHLEKALALLEEALKELGLELQ